MQKCVRFCTIISRLTRACFSGGEEALHKLYQPGNRTWNESRDVFEVFMSKEEYTVSESSLAGKVTCMRTCQFNKFFPQLCTAGQLIVRKPPPPDSNYHYYRRVSSTPSMGLWVRDKWHIMSVTIIHFAYLQTAGVHTCAQGVRPYAIHFV